MPEAVLQAPEADSLPAPVFEKPSFAPLPPLNPVPDESAVPPLRAFEAREGAPVERLGAFREWLEEAIPVDDFLVADRHGLEIIGSAGASEALVILGYMTALHSFRTLSKRQFSGMADFQLKDGKLYLFEASHGEESYGMSLLSRQNLGQEHLAAIHQSFQNAIRP